jgi:signal transduction histidine kinase
MRPELWLEIAGFGTWIVSSLPAIIGLMHGQISTARAAVWAVAFAAFGAAFGMLCRDGFGRTPALTVRRALIAVQTLAALVMVAAIRDTLPAALVVVVAGQLLSAFPAPVAIAWTIAQSAVLGRLFWGLADAVIAVAVGGAFGGFQMFALAAAALAQRERAARETLALTHAELLATRTLLAENSRVDERLRIARDLHDTLGHHLTALSLQLDVASRMAGGAAAAHVQQAHAITRLLLGDVRDVVSRTRDSSRIDLAEAIRALTSVPGDLAIHLDLPEALPIDDSARAHALLRCVQEIITNTARHANAANLWIRIAAAADGITVHARDDGRGATALAWGNGLRGMRERFEEYAGRVEFGGGAGEGFEVRAFLPTPQVAS